jgi:endogenous inhibitor of DNA gyrase (YacG/DUF329 family)
MKKVKCPTCKMLVNWSDENSFKPFCCQRCRLIDLGNWADGRYCITNEDEEKNQFEEHDK